MGGMTKQHTWTDFYSELADKLLPYKSNRAELVRKVMAVYERSGIKPPKLDSVMPPLDIDPYTIYGLFNKGITEENRRKLIAAVAQEFGVKSAQPKDFDGIPILNNLNATFYAFSNDPRRKGHDIDNLWHMFEAEIALADDDTAYNREAFVAAYNEVIPQFGLGWKLSMGMYWSRPFRFINLDSCNRSFMEGGQAGGAVAAVAPKSNDKPIHDGERYLYVCDEIRRNLGTEACPYADFPSLSHAAFIAPKQTPVKPDPSREPKPPLGEMPPQELRPYGKEDFLNEVFMPEKSYDALVNVLKAKKNVILQGAPGVGKTFAAKRLAYSMMGAKDADRVMMVQFHQSYSYEDFVEGFRPTQQGFELAKGAFYSFCKAAAEDEGNDWFFIIDEINRGNLSKVFGELFMLIENDKRGPKNKLRLLYSHEPFYVPENVYVIGMMNTADRSLAMLDYALRRRFAFFDLRPGFDTEGFDAYQKGLNSKMFDALVARIRALNEEISSDESLGEGFCIGHSYLCGLEEGDATEERLSAIVEYEVAPMLREYWFDDPDRAWNWANDLRKAVK